MLLQELMPDELRNLHLREGILKELKKRVTTDGISSLKISLIMFGYYIEVRNLHKDKFLRSGLENKP
jgi:hypothetical protein